MWIFRNAVRAGFCLAILPLILAMPAGAASGQGLTGSWARDDGSTRMIIAPCGAALCATNTFVKDPNGRERVGDRLILNLKPVSSNDLQGDAYDVRRQMHFKMTIMLNGATMRTTGCVLLGLACKSAGWTRLN